MTGQDMLLTRLGLVEFLHVLVVLNLLAVSLRLEACSKEGFNPQASEMLTKLKSGQGLLTLEASSLWWSLADRNVVPRKLKIGDRLITQTSHGVVNLSISLHFVSQFFFVIHTFVGLSSGIVKTKTLGGSVLQGSTIVENHLDLQVS